MQDILNKIFNGSKISHTQFAKDVDIAKSYVLSMLNGSKPITENIYKRMMQLDYVAPYAAELTDHYMRRKFGSESYELMQYWFETSKEFSFDATVPPPAEASDFSESQRLLGTEELIRLICGLFRKTIRNNEPFYTNYSFSFTALDEALYATAKEQKLYSDEIFLHTVWHPHSLDKEAVTTFWKSLRWGLVRVITKVCFSHNASLPFPYYAVCGDTAIIFSENGGYLIKSEGIAREYIEHHNSSHSQPLVSVVHDETELLTAGVVELNATKQIALDNVICPCGVIDSDMLYEFASDSLPHEIKAQLIEAFMQYYSYMDTIDRTVYTQIEAVYEWLKTGRFCPISKKYIRHFSPEARKKLLDRFADMPNVKLLREGSIYLPNGFAVDSFDSEILVHFLFPEDNDEDYELCCVYPFSQIHGLEEFVQNIFEFLDYEFNVYPDENRRVILKQLAILGDYNLN